ncbi:MAG TPA: hypothetical protein VMV98_05040, partial [Acidobacteriaceae bacterium]|nr:hypothetical protein [Acidobacteriaceae bacterium]
MNKLKLSVVLCTWNGATYLQPQLDSLLAQSRLPDEIVIGDLVRSRGQLLCAEAQRLRRLED